MAQPTAKALRQAILNSVADGVFTVDRSWHITSFNRAAERITGISAEQAIGKRCSHVFRADICEGRCALRKTLETGRQIIDVPARIRDSEGCSIPISLSTSALHDAKGRLLGAVETFRDLSAQAADSALHQTVLSSIADGVFSVDHDWRITSFNRAAERITGIRAEQAIGKKCSDIFHADICDGRCALRKTLQTGEEIIDTAARIVDGRGHAKPISLSTAVLRNANGRLLGAVETFRDLSAIEQLRREIASQYSFEDIIGKSQAFKRIFSLLPDVAQSDASVMIEGPSGSGKELIARAVHNLSLRRKGPFVAVNCGALPVNLFESELFGYARGAFTDAKRDKPGRLKLAEGGTLFLDEVSELPLETQVKLLRVLQEREYEPLGGVQTVRTNVRIVAATNAKLIELVSQGKFRDDLFFRLGVVRLSIPPLHKRREDIPPLVENFVQRFNTKRGKKILGLKPGVMEVLMRHDFPGNARELENIIEYAFVLCHEKLVDICHLPEELQPRDPQRSAKPSAPRSHTQLKWAEADVIRTALLRTNGSIGAASTDLGISRTTLWRKMKRFSLSADDFRQDHRAASMQD